MLPGTLTAGDAGKGPPWWELHPSRVGTLSSTTIFEDTLVVSCETEFVHLGVFVVVLLVFETLSI